MDTKALRQKILDLAIRGKLVPQDPNDEPASVLLERIRAEKERLIAEGKIKPPKKSKSSATPHYENLPFEIPDNWEWSDVNNIGEVITGTTPAKDIPAYYGTDYPFYKPSDLDNGKNVVSSVDGLSELGILQARKLKKASILVTCVGATIGKTGIIQNEGASNQQINAIEPYTSIEPLYIYYLYISNYAQKYILDNASATTLPIINKNKFSSMPIPLPPLSEQLRIVSEIERWFALIDEVDTDKYDLQNLISQTKSKILSLAIQGKLIAQDPADEPAESLLRRINPKWQPCDTSHYENISNGWEVCCLSDIADFELGKTLDREKNTGFEKPYLCALNVLWGEFNMSLVKTMKINPSEYERYSIKRGDLLICEGGEVGRCAVWSCESEIFYQNALHRVRFKENISPYYIYYILRHLKNIGTVDEYAKGMTIKHLTKSSLNSIPIILPPVAEQQRIVAKVERLFRLLDDILAHLD